MLARQVWAVILAGGQGTRMLDWIEATSGTRRPKQFCTFTGSRSMLEHTLSRARAVAAPQNTVTVITRGQRQHLAAAVRGELPGLVVEQPADRGTAAAVLFALAHIMEQEPEAVVLILPADHYVRPEASFALHARFACHVAGELPGRFVVLGAAPDGPETDYGWIAAEPATTPGRRAAMQLRHVTHFREKPDAKEAARLYEAGALWNTLVVAARARTLWSFAARLLPEPTARFSLMRGVIRTARVGHSTDTVAGTIVSWLYQGMPFADFSRSILQEAAHATFVAPLRGVEWSDWGRPERVLKTLQRASSAPTASISSALIV